MRPLLEQSRQAPATGSASTEKHKKPAPLLAPSHPVNPVFSLSRNRSYHNIYKPACLLSPVIQINQQDCLFAKSDPTDRGRGVCMDCAESMALSF